MNLMHLHAKRDKNLVVGPEVRPIKRAFAEAILSGFMLPSSGQGIRVKTLLRWFPFCEGTTATGWTASSPLGGRVELSFRDTKDEIIQTCLIETDPSHHPIVLPDLPPTLSRSEKALLDFSISNVSPDGQAITVYVTETVPTEPFYQKAIGFGVEIGPGPYPRILPSPTRQVFYVERETVDEFKKKYNFKGKFDSLDSPEAQAFWSQVTVGRANDLPYADDSLDFIFSADVVEHLVNPIGHFSYWRRKLKPGGKILAIIPHIYGCSDYINRPTPISYWKQQYDQGSFDETPLHHEAFALPRNLRANDLFMRGYSSHFSFFDENNLAALLRFCVAEFGFSSMNIDYRPNAKKMHFELCR